MSTDDGTEDVDTPELAATEDEREAFERGYFTAAWWVATGAQSPDDLPDHDRTLLTEEATWFVDYLEAVLLIRRAGVIDPRYTFEQAGHDFYLTRERHGAGFWDRGLGEVGDQLTEIAHPFGSSDFYYEPR